MTDDQKSWWGQFATNGGLLLLVIGCLISAWLTQKNFEAKQMRKAEDKAEQQQQELERIRRIELGSKLEFYILLLESLKMANEKSLTVIVDKDSKVIYADPDTLKKTELKVGGKLSALFPASDRMEHEKTVRTAVTESDGIQRITDVKCSIEIDGTPTPVHVKSWTTTSGLAIGVINPTG